MRSSPTNTKSWCNKMPEYSSAILRAPQRDQRRIARGRSGGPRRLLSGHAMTVAHIAADRIAPPSAERLPYKWKLLVSVIFGVFMSTLDTTAVNVAFPTLRSMYGATLHEAQWIVSIYVMALGIATPVAGFLADRFGIKRIYVLGLAIFVSGSIVAGF